MKLSYFPARLAVAVAFAWLAPAAFAHEGQQTGGFDPDARGEAFVHTLPGTDVVGAAPGAPVENGWVLSVRVVDDDTGEPVSCRVNVRDAGGQFYEPGANILAPWSLHRLGNRVGKGPFRYFGWFFYCDGAFDVRVPAGEIVVEVWKGFEYRPAVQRIHVRRDVHRQLEVRLERTVDMAARGWYSGDTHIHLNRRSEAEEARALDLVAAEDIRFGYLLAMNDAKTYVGEMSAQDWQQLRGMGRASVARRGAYAISSGQEYRCSTYGHICLLLAKDLVLRGQSMNPNEWPLFDRVAAETHALGGVAFHAHGGYEKEIYADFVHGNTDGVELLQFAVYRGVALPGWYHMLNAGFAFPAVGASDYPYCRVLGDCRTYAFVEGEATVEAWTKAVAEGRSFFTTGPLLGFTVNGTNAGDRIDVDPDVASVRVELEVLSEVAPVERAEIVVNGNTVAAFDCSDGLPQSQRFEADIPCAESMWVAARVYGEQLDGFPDADAHTNPVYVIRDGAPIRNADSIRWLIDRVDERLMANARRNFEHRDEVVEYFEQTKSTLEQRLKAMGTP